MRVLQDNQVEIRLLVFLIFVVVEVVPVKDEGAFFKGIGVQAFLFEFSLALE